MQVYKVIITSLDLERNPQEEYILMTGKNYQDVLEQVLSFYTMPENQEDLWKVSMERFHDAIGVYFPNEADLDKTINRAIDLLP